MRDKIYLVFNQEKVVRMVKSTPATKKGEKYLSINIQIDNSIFEESQYSANLVVDKDDLESIIKGFELELNRIKSNE